MYNQHKLMHDPGKVFAGNDFEPQIRKLNKLQESSSEHQRVLEKIIDILQTTKFDEELDKKSKQIDDLEHQLQKIQNKITQENSQDETTKNIHDILDDILNTLNTNKHDAINHNRREAINCVFDLLINLNQQNGQIKLTTTNTVSNILDAVQDLNNNLGTEVRFLLNNYDRFNVQEKVILDKILILRQGQDILIDLVNNYAQNGNVDNIIQNITETADLTSQLLQSKNLLPAILASRNTSVASRVNKIVTGANIFSNIAHQFKSQLVTITKDGIKAEDLMHLSPEDAREISANANKHHEFLLHKLQIEQHISPQTDQDNELKFDVTTLSYESLLTDKYIGMKKFLSYNDNMSYSTISKDVNTFRNIYGLDNFVFQDDRAIKDARQLMDEAEYVSDLSSEYSYKSKNKLHNNFHKLNYLSEYNLSETELRQFGLASAVKTSLQVKAIRRTQPGQFMKFLAEKFKLSDSKNYQRQTQIMLENIDKELANIRKRIINAQKLGGDDKDKQIAALTKVEEMLSKDKMVLAIEAKAIGGYITLFGDVFFKVIEFLPAIMGAAGLFSLTKLMEGAKSSAEGQGKILANTALVQTSMGESINPRELSYLMTQDIQYSQLTYQMVAPGEFMQFRNSLLAGGKRYGADSNQTNYMANALFSEAKLYDAQGGIQQLVTTMQRDGQDSLITVQSVQNAAAAAKQAGIPINSYIGQVATFAKTMQAAGMPITQATATINRFILSNWRPDDAIKTIQTNMSNIEKAIPKAITNAQSVVPMLLSINLSGQQRIGNWQAETSNSALSHDERGNARKGWYEMQAQRQISMYQLALAAPGGGGAQLAKDLRAQGYSRVEASQIHRAIKNNDVQILSNLFQTHDEKDDTKSMNELSAETEKYDKALGKIVNVLAESHKLKSNQVKAFQDTSKAYNDVMRKIFRPFMTDIFDAGVNFVKKANELLSTIAKWPNVKDVYNKLKGIIPSISDTIMPLFNGLWKLVSGALSVAGRVMPEAKTIQGLKKFIEGIPVVDALLEGIDEEDKTRAALEGRISDENSEDNQLFDNTDKDFFDDDNDDNKIEDTDTIKSDDDYIGANSSEETQNLLNDMQKKEELEKKAQQELEEWRKANQDAVKIGSKKTSEIMSRTELDKLRNFDVYGHDIIKILESNTEMGNIFRNYMRTNGLDYDKLTKTEKDMFAEMCKKYGALHKNGRNTLNQVMQNAGKQGVRANNTNQQTKQTGTVGDAVIELTEEELKQAQEDAHAHAYYVEDSGYDPYTYLLQYTEQQLGRSDLDLKEKTKLQLAEQYFQLAINNGGDFSEQDNEQFYAAFNEINETNKNGGRLNWGESGVTQKIRGMNIRTQFESEILPGLRTDYEKQQFEESKSEIAKQKIERGETGHGEKTDVNSSPNVKSKMSGNGYLTDYKQWDDAWADDSLGEMGSGLTIGTSGCGITALANVANWYGGNYDPRTMRNELLQNGGLTSDGLLQEGIEKWGANHGISVEWVGANESGVDMAKQKVLSALQSGYTVIAYHSAGETAIQTGSNHYVAYNSMNSDGSINVFDPGHDSQAYSQNDLLNGGSTEYYILKDSNHAIGNTGILHPDTNGVFGADVARANLNQASGINPLITLTDNAERIRSISKSLFGETVTAHGNIRNGLFAEKDKEYESAEDLRENAKKRSYTAAKYANQAALVAIQQEIEINKASSKAKISIKNVAESGKEIIDENKIAQAEAEEKAAEAIPVTLAVQTDKTISPEKLTQGIAKILSSSSEAATVQQFRKSKG